MPEGDTIYRAAAGLRRALLGQKIVAAEAGAAKRPGQWPFARLVGTTVEAVEPRGKHLLIRFSNGLTLHSHLQMSGSWQLYRAGDRWRLPRHLARAVLKTAEVEAVCFRAPTVELLSPSELAVHPALASLGPDLLDPDFDPLTARQRLRTLAHEQIGVALLDQRALAGIGNVYKSEALFVGRQSPFTSVGELSDAALDALIEQARRLLRANRETSMRVTTGLERPGAALWVYEREGRPCRRCGTPIQRARQASRSTYWCPSCQK